MIQEEFTSFCKDEIRVVLTMTEHQEKFTFLHDFAL